MKVLVLVVLVQAVYLVSSQCPQYWKSNKQGRCFLWSMDLTDSEDDEQKFQTWRGARRYCQSKGGDLVSIHSQQEQMFLETLMEDRDTTAMYIGLNELDDTFKWSDGTAVDYTNWAPGEPNDWNGHEMCVEMRTNNNYDGMTIFTPEEYKYYFPGINPPVRAWITLDIKACKEANLILSGRTKEIDNPYQIVIGGGNNEDVIIRGDIDKNTLKTAKSKDVLDCNAPRSFWISWKLGKIEVGKGSKYGENQLVYWQDPKPREVNGIAISTRGVVGTWDINGLPGEWNDVTCSLSYGFICSKRERATPFPPTEPPPMPGFCPAGFTRYKDKCYQVNTSSKDWEAAQADCQKKLTFKRCNLASISSKEEQAFIISLMVGKKGNFWIGLRQFVTGKYLWADNTDVTFTNWAKDNPSKGKSTNLCTAMYFQPYRAGQWLDAWKKTKNNYICMSYVQSDVPTPAPPPSNPCGDGWMPFNDNCYQAVVDPMTWEDASTFCTKYDQGYLVSIVDGFEQAFIYSYLAQFEQEPMWLGLNDKSTPGTFRWSDDWPVTYVNWGKGQPDREEGGCVYMDEKSFWYDVDCDQPYSFLCKRSSRTPPHTYPPLTGSCKFNDGVKDWVAFGDHCYIFETGDIKSQVEARSDCELSNAVLASVHGSTEMNFLRNRLKQTTSGEAWIGMRKTLNKGWEWVDGSPVEFVNWKPGFPQDKDGSKNWNCVAARQGGKWVDKECAETAGYVCKREQIPPTPTPAAGMSGGEKAGIVISVFAFAIVCTILVVMLYSISRGGQPLDVFTDLKNKKFGQSAA